MPGIFSGSSNIQVRIVKWVLSADENSIITCGSQQLNTFNRSIRVLEWYVLILYFLSDVKLMFVDQINSPVLLILNLFVEIRGEVERIVVGNSLIEIVLNYGTPLAVTFELSDVLPRIHEYLHTVVDSVFSSFFRSIDATDEPTLAIPECN